MKKHNSPPMQLILSLAILVAFALGFATATETAKFPKKEVITMPTPPPNTVEITIESNDSRYALYLGEYVVVNPIDKHSIFDYCVGRILDYHDLDKTSYDVQLTRCPHSKNPDMKIHASGIFLVPYKIAKKERII